MPKPANININIKTFPAAIGHPAITSSGAQFTQLRVIADLLVVGVASRTRKNLG
jgi:hypothetical protein